MTGVPDTNLIDALRPLKADADSKPTCANCPCGARDVHGAIGTLVCVRYPPEMSFVMRNTVAGPVPVPQVGFKPVHPSMVCWEHPALQARLRRAVAKAEARLGDLNTGRYDRMVVGTPVNPDVAGTPVHVVGDFEPAAVAEADGRKPGDDPG